MFTSLNEELGVRKFQAELSARWQDPWAHRINMWYDDKSATMPESERNVQLEYYRELWRWVRDTGGFTGDGKEAYVAYERPRFYVNNVFPQKFTSVSLNRFPPVTEYQKGDLVHWSDERWALPWTLRLPFGIEISIRRRRFTKFKNVVFENCSVRDT